MDQINRIKNINLQLVLGFDNSDYPFFGDYLLNMQIVKGSLPGTYGMATTIKDSAMYLVIDVDIIKSLSDKQVITVLFHEVLHNVLLHTSIRSNKSVSLIIENIVADLAVNSILQKMNRDTINLIPDACFPSQFGFPELLSKEEYLKLLMKNSRSIKINGDGTVSIDGQVYKMPTAPEADNPLIAREVQRATTKDAYTKNELRGTLPGELKKILDEILGKAELDWRYILMQFIYGHIKTLKRSSRHKEHRRFPDMPGFVSRRTAEIVIALDTSGSISDKLYSQFLLEVRKIARTSRQSNYWVIECDAEIQEMKQLQKYKLITKKTRKGYGGTDFRPVFNKMKKINADLLVFFTDLYGDFPEKKPHIPTLWVTPTKNKSVPFGLVTHIKDKEDD